jgi:hypothetical protein
VQASSTTGYLATPGVPNWYARFAAQLMNDPALQPVLTLKPLKPPDPAGFRRRLGPFAYLIGRRNFAMNGWT